MALFEQTCGHNDETYIQNDRYSYRMFPKFAKRPNIIGLDKSIFCMNIINTISNLRIGCPFFEKT